MSEKQTVKVLYAPDVRCGACGCVLVFEPRSFKDNSVDCYGKCTWCQCENSGKRIHVKMQIVECEYDLL